VSDRHPLSLSVGLAYFNPLLPIGIDELLQEAERAMYEHKRTIRLAEATHAAIPFERANHAARRTSLPSPPAASSSSRSWPGISGTPGTPA
jgi:hypothetical protein